MYRACRHLDIIVLKNIAIVIRSNPQYRNIYVQQETTTDIAVRSNYHSPNISCWGLAEIRISIYW